MPSDGIRLKRVCVCVLSRAVVLYPKHKANYWAKVARHVGTRSAEDCYNQHTFQGASQSPATKEKKRGKKQLEAAKGPGRDKSASQMNPVPTAVVVAHVQGSDVPQPVVQSTR